MEPRETNLPIVIGLALSVAAHLGIAAGYGPLHQQETVGTAFLAEKPDLSVTGISVSSPRVAGKPSTFTAAIANQTTAVAGPFVVELRIDGVSAGRKLVDAGAAGRGALDVGIEFTVTKPGEHAVRIIADPDGRVAETDESNNEIEQRFVWQRPEDAETKPPSGSPKSASSSGVLGLPDLAVTSLDVAHPRIAGDPAKLTAKIANTGGSAASAFNVKVLVDDQPAGVIALGDLPAGAAIDVQMNVVAKKDGPHTVTVIADPEQTVTESDKANNKLTRRFDWILPDEIPIGQKNGDPVSMNWIGYEDYKELMARRGRFEQATFQRDVEPTPLANQTPLNPTAPSPAAKKPADSQETPSRAKPNNEDAVAAAPKPAMPVAPREPVAASPPPRPAAAATPAPAPLSPPPAPAPVASKPTPPAPPPSVAEKPTNPQPPKPASPAPVAEPREVALVTPPSSPDPLGVALPTKPVDPTSPSQAIAAKPVPPTVTPPTPAQTPVKPVTPAVPKTPAPTPVVKPVPAQPPVTAPPSAKPAAPEPSAATAEARPTIAPRDERDASPQSLREAMSVTPGRVVSRLGLQINTVRPNFSAVAMRSAISNNPDVMLTFDTGGKVVKVKIVRGTGFENIDGPLLTSLYRWTATGEPLKKISGTLDVPFHIILVDETRDE